MSRTYFQVQKNRFESVVVRWMNLEPVRQSEVKKNKYNILKHIYGIWRNSADEPNCSEGMEITDIEYRHVGTVGEGEGGIS